MDMTRESKSLDGRWEIAFDHGNIGKQRRWTRWERFLADAPREFIDVPACWERFRQDYEGVAWYGHTFAVPDEWEGRSIRIHFGAVNYVAEVYFNDQAIGYHEGGYTDFTFEIGDIVRFGEPNTLVLRVIGPILTQDKEIDGIGRDDMPHWRGAIAGGIWQSVTLVAGDRVHVADVFADPDVPHSRVHALVTVENTTLHDRELTARLRVVPLGVAADGLVPGAPIAEKDVLFTAAPGETTFATDLDLDAPQLWSLESPFLYRLDTELLDGEAVIDGDGTRFGMRQFLIQNDDYVMNGSKLLVKSVFFEGLYPTTLAAPPDEAFVRHELQLAKDAGINLIRPWRKPQPPIVYDLADEMGILFVGTMPFEGMGRWPTMTPYVERRMKDEVRESVRRDRNHPSIAMWEIFNEISRPSLKRIKHRVSREARKLDPSRLILDESGGFSGGAFVYPPNSSEPFQINDVHHYPGAPFDQAGYDRLLALAKTDEQLVEMGMSQPKKHGSDKQKPRWVTNVSEMGWATLRSGARRQIPGRFTHVSEIGYGSLPDLEVNVEQYRREGNPLTPDYRYHSSMLDHFGQALAFTGLNEVFPTVRDFCMATQEIHATANKLMVEAIRMNPDVDGFGIHAYTDGDYIVGAGLVDIFRNPKKAYYAAAETNQPVYLALRTSSRNVYGPDEVEMTANVASELAEPFDARLEGEVTGPDGQVVTTFERSVRISQGVTPLMSETLVTEGMDGLCTLRARLWRDDEKVTENAYEFRVVPRASIHSPRAEFAVLDPAGVLSAALASRGVPFEQFGVDTPKNTLVLADAKALHFSDSGEAGAALVTFVRSGGTVVYLDLPPGERSSSTEESQHLVTEWLPLQLCMRPTRGTWAPFAHVIREHPVSRGLPADKIMDQDYVNVFPHVSVIKVAEVDPSVPFVGMDLWSWLGQDAARAPIGTLGLDSQSGTAPGEFDYRGSGPVVYGADLIDWPCGQGRVVLSTLRLIDNLGHDPVADMLLTNIVDWCMQQRSL